MAKKDFYEVLGVSKNASEAEIKSAFTLLISLERNSSNSSCNWFESKLFSFVWK